MKRRRVLLVALSAQPVVQRRITVAGVSPTSMMTRMAARTITTAVAVASSAFTKRTRGARDVVVQAAAAHRHQAAVVKLAQAAVLRAATQLAAVQLAQAAAVDPADVGRNTLRSSVEFACCAGPLPNFKA
jgi:hypothetical protein